MSQLAMLDAPACLDLATVGLGPPREPHEPQRPAWWPAAAEHGGTQSFRDRAVRECLDTISLLRAYREPLPRETWRRPLASERRLLAQANAILALGARALGQVVDLAIDDDLPHPGRVFAALFVLGCAEGQAWQQAIVRIFTQAVQRHPNESAAAIEALGLAPNRHLARSLSDLRDDARPRVRAAVVRVLAFRWALRPAQWCEAMRDDDPSVVLAAACAPLGGYEREVCEQALSSLPRHTENDMRASLAAGFGLRLSSTYHQAVELSRRDPGWAGALQCVGMFGFLSDVDLVREALQGPGWREAVRAAALLGRVALIPDLLTLPSRQEVAAAEEEEIKHAAATITGLPFGTTEDFGAAQLLWTSNAHRFTTDRRYRIGSVYHPRVLLRCLAVDEATDWRCHMRETRQQTMLELAAVTGWRLPRFNAYDFVAVQAASMSRVERWVNDQSESDWAAGPLR